MENNASPKVSRLQRCPGDMKTIFAIHWNTNHTEQGFSMEKQNKSTKKSDQDKVLQSAQVKILPVHTNRKSQGWVLFRDDIERWRGYYYLRAVNLPPPCVVDHTTRISKQQEFSRQQRCHILIFIFLKPTYPTLIPSLTLCKGEKKKSSSGNFVCETPCQESSQLSQALYNGHHILRVKRMSRKNNDQKVEME